MELKESSIFNEIGKLNDIELTKIKNMMRRKFITFSDINGREGSEVSYMACVVLQELIFDIYVALKRENINNDVYLRDIYLYDNIISLFWDRQLTIVKYDSSYKEIRRSIYYTNILKENRALKNRLEEYIFLMMREDRISSIECNGYYTSGIYGRTLRGFENMASVMFDREYLKRGDFKFWNQEESEAWFMLKEFNDTLDNLMKKDDAMKRPGKNRLSLIDNTGKELSLGDVFLVYAKYDDLDVKLIDELVEKQEWHSGYQKFNALSNSWLQRNIMC